MQGSRALWRAQPAFPALGSGDDQRQRRPRPASSTHPHPIRDTTTGRCRDEVEDDDAARAAAAALALASEPTIEKMVPIPNHNHPGREQQQQQQQQGEDVVEGCNSRRPDASLVAARGALRSGYLWKMGANVPRWKRRFFVLKPITMLFYYMSEHDTEPRGCIDLDLFDAVRKVREDGVAVGCDEKGFSAGDSSGSSGGGKRRRGESTTTFELYRSGCPDGSGFMLEARGDEDWEEWVESIANGRHGKMQAEMDVMKGANKLLLDEINGLEQQVATFRGYADQRHVTVLALRDERHRNREVAAELAALADTASALSHLISQGVKEDQQQQQQQQQQCDTVVAAEEADAAGAAAQHHHQAAALIDAAAAAAAAEEVSPSSSPPTSSRTSRRRRSVHENDFDFPPPQPPPTARGGGGDSHHHHHHNQEQLSEQIAEERLSFEAIRRALAEARAELGRKGRALRQETDRRRAVEERVRGAEGFARAAEKRAEAAEGATARANGRVSVLERNVEYLQTQQRSLRAELCQARHKTQLVRAQKAVLKREVRDMWSRHTHTSPSSRGPPAPGNPDHRGAPSKHHQRQQAGGGRGGGEPQSAPLRCRARTWASMGDLAEADVSPPAASGGGGVEEGGASSSLSTRPSNRRRSMTGASTRTSSEISVAVGRLAGAEEGEGEEEAGRRSVRSRQQRGGGSLRSCLSKESLTAASDGGETDFADRTNSEASDLEDESTRFSGHSAHEAGASINGNGSITSPFRESVCRTIRKRVGAPQVPPLPPTRHHRTLTAIKRLRSFSDNSVEATQQLQQSEGAFGGGGGGGGGGGLGNFAVGRGGGGGGSAGGASSAVAGLGVAGMFLGLRKGMVDKAAQEMGKKLALWPGAGMPSVSSLGSLAAGAISGATGGSGNSATATAGDNIAAESGSGGGMGGGGGLHLHPQTPVGSPRSASASFSTALTDSPVRWDPPSRHGSTASTDPGSDTAAPVPAPGGRDGEAEDSLTPAKQPHYFVPASGVAATADATSALSPAAVGGGGLPRVSSVSSRTALIQLSDLELAEPCGRQIVGGGAPPACGSGVGVGVGVGGAKGGDDQDGGNNGSRRTSIASTMSMSSSASSSSLSLSARSSTSTPAKQRRLPLLPPRPDDEYELVFTSRVIGLQFKELPDGTGVYVAGSDGYVGPAPTTGVPGERLCPDNGDVLESYNGISARGKAADVVAGELAQCGRPLRLGFRAARAEVIAEESDEQDEEEDEEEGGVAWASGYGSGGGGSGGSGSGPWRGGGAEAGAGAGGGSSCRDDAVAFAAPSHPWAVSS